VSDLLIFIENHRKLPAKKEKDCCVCCREQNIDHLNGSDPEQCMSNVRRVFMKNASQSMYNTANNAVLLHKQAQNSKYYGKVNKNWQQCSAFTV